MTLPLLFGQKVESRNLRELYMDRKKENCDITLACVRKCNINCPKYLENTSDSVSTSILDKITELFNKKLKRQLLKYT